MSEPTPDPTPKRKPGNPNAAKANLSGKANPETVKQLRARLAEFEAAEKERARVEGEADAEGGVITAARMRKVLGQEPAADAGALERRLRDWLNKGTGPYVAKLREMEAEDARLAEERAEAREFKERALVAEAELLKIKSAAKGGKDAGSAAARELIQRIMVAHGVKR